MSTPLPSPSEQPPQPPSDPFRKLALVCILLGMVIVIGGVAFWVITNRQSSTIIGAGVAMAIGGGLRNALTTLADQIPAYIPPPPEIPEPTPSPPPRGRKGRRE